MIRLVMVFGGGQGIAVGLAMHAVCLAMGFVILGSLGVAATVMSLTTRGPTVGDASPTSVILFAVVLALVYLVARRAARWLARYCMRAYLADLSRGKDEDLHHA